MSNHDYKKAEKWVKARLHHEVEWEDYKSNIPTIKHALSTMDKLTGDKQNYNWYYDFVENPPFKIIQSNPKCFIVMENPERIEVVGLPEVTSNDIMLCERFDNQEQAVAFRRFKNAEWLHKAMVAQLFKEIEKE